MLPYRVFALYNLSMLCWQLKLHLTRLKYYYEIFMHVNKSGKWHSLELLIYAGVKKLQIQWINTVYVYIYFIFLYAYRNLNIIFFKDSALICGSLYFQKL